MCLCSDFDIFFSPYMCIANNTLLHNHNVCLYVCVCVCVCVCSITTSSTRDQNYQNRSSNTFSRSREVSKYFYTVLKSDN